MARTKIMHAFRDAHPLGAGTCRRLRRAPRLECESETHLALPNPKIPVTKAFSARDALSSAQDALNQFAAKLDAAIKNSPASELEKNARQHFISQLAKHGLVTREEYEVQVALLEKARAKLKELETRIALLEADRVK